MIVALAIRFLVIGALAFGGGQAALPWWSGWLGQRGSGAMEHASAPDYPAALSIDTTGGHAPDRASPVTTNP